MARLVLDDRLSDADNSAIDFRHTAFFKPRGDPPSEPELPSPESVCTRSSGARAGQVRYEELGLLVKYGPPHRVKREEAQVMQALRRAFPRDEVFVPELYGWRVSDGLNFIYMELIQGLTLKDVWPTLTPSEIERIFTQLAQAIAKLRQLPQCAPTPWLGSISQGFIQDLYFLGVELGPFFSVKDFHDSVQSLVRYHVLASDPFRPLLHDDSKVYFTHADLHLENIMISGQPGNRNIAAILDWEQAGWYPEYWEYCKLSLFAEDYENLRVWGWPNKLMQRYKTAWYAFAEYWSARAP